MTRSRVDLPQPFGPTMATISCSATRTSTSSSAIRREPSRSKLRETPRSSMASNSCASGHTVEAPGGEGRVGALGMGAQRSKATIGRHTVGGRLAPSLIRTMTVGSLQGIHRHRVVDGSWAGGWTNVRMPPTTGRGFHPTPKARLLCALCRSTIAAARLFPGWGVGHVVRGPNDRLQVHRFWGILWPQ
jgi:hypothetical protein